MNEPTYIVTDLHSPKRERWLTWARVGRFVRSDVIAIGLVLLYLARGIAWVGRQPANGPVGRLVHLAIRFGCIVVVVTVIASGIGGGS